MSFAFANDYSDFEERPLTEGESRVAWILYGVLVAAIVLAYGNMLAFTSSFWVKGLYSHGWIVPLIAGYLFWIQRRPLVDAPASDRWIGVGILVAALGDPRVGFELRLQQPRSAFVHRGAAGDAA